MAQGEGKERRRQLHWYRGFQPGFIWGLTGAVTAAALSAIFSALLVAQVMNRLVVPSSLLTLLLVFSCITLLALAMVVYWVMLFVSHRMGGPLYRFECVINGMGCGHLNERVDLRKNDQLQDVAQTINQAIDGLNQRVAGLKTRALALQQEIQASGDARLSRQASELVESLEKDFVL